MIWIGADHGEITQKFRRLIKGSKFSAQHHLISFQSRERLATWYHASDVILFPQPSISVQEALGTGAHILCPPDPSLDHLNEYSRRIDYVPIEHWPNRLKEICREMVDRHEERDQARISAADDARALSYPHLIQCALDELDQRITS
jgi:hypothetical protein